VIPISRGGVHTYSNVQVSHRTCNRWKWAKLPEELTGSAA
jgi:5-methylcytosine-specific restriction endonuclease McrA